jgi:hypothetical protein
MLLIPADTALLNNTRSKVVRNLAHKIMFHISQNVIFYLTLLAALLIQLQCSCQKKNYVNAYLEVNSSMPRTNGT